MHASDGEDAASGRRGALVIFPPPRVRGTAIAGIVAAAGLLLAVVLLWRAAGMQVSFAAFLEYTAGAVLLVAGLLLAYWSWAAATLRYELRAGVLSIHWGMVERRIALQEIERVVLGRNLPVPQVSGFRLPGVAVGRAYVQRAGMVAVYLRYLGPQNLLYLVTGDGSVGLSLVDVQPFVRALQQAQAEASGREPSRLRRGWLLSLGFWSDPRALALAGAGLVLAWLSAGIVYMRFQGRPAALIVHFPATETAHLASRSELLQIPASAVAWFAIAAVLAVVLFNRARLVSYLLLGGSAIAGMVFVIAALGATG